MASVNQGARIEMLALGNGDEALSTGKYWADKLAFGAKLDYIGLSRLKSKQAWKVIIQYQKKGADHESTLS